MNAVGIDVSKGKSMIAVMQPLGIVVASPFEVCHTEGELSKLAGFLKSLIILLCNMFHFMRNIVKLGVVLFRKYCIILFVILLKMNFIKK